MNTQAASAGYIHRALGHGARLASDYPGAEHAPLDYPGTRPDSSFVYVDGVVLPLDASSREGLRINAGRTEMYPLDEFLAARDSALLSSRFAVLAVGSNACPGRLEEKYKAQSRDPIVVLKGWIADIDSIYAGWLADYGALPATITESLGTDVEIWVTLLTSAQLAMMNTSERLDDDYALVFLASPFRAGEYTIGNVYAYFDRRALVLEGQRVRLADFRARAAKHRALTEREALAAVLDQLDFHRGEPIELRHRALVSSPATAATLNARLAESHMTLNDCGHSIIPASTRKLQTLRWSVSA